jgi:hypothetical protein
MPNAFGVALVALLAAVAAAWTFGLVKTEQIVYVATMIGGWTAWTCLIALGYAGLEKLFPDRLCAPPAEDC